VELGELPTIQADPLQLRQLFQNLIGNALKYHRPDVPPVVKVTAIRQDHGWTLTVDDNGIGFDEKTRKRYSEFQRLHGRGEYEGSGIGLSVCKKIVERHGGTITAHGRPGEGAMF